MITILSLAWSAAVLAQAPQKSAAREAEATTHARQVEKKNQHDVHAPNPDLIEFLGDYEDAADGLDPIGWSEQPSIENQSDAAPTTAAKKKKDGNGP